eukprot:3756005-Heterocapsa_arctica.AAC.1
MAEPLGRGEPPAGTEGRWGPIGGAASTCMHTYIHTYACMRLGELVAQQPRRRRDADDPLRGVGAAGPRPKR